LLKQALKGYKKISSGDEIPLLEAVENLGNLYGKQGRPNKAKKMYKRILVGFEDVFGHSHDRCQKIKEAIIALKNSRKGVELVERNE
jgi:tetratricopeptide (TPR) repeat protein